MFDPFQIYERSQVQTHNGQIIRKKLPKYHGKVYSQKELENCIPALRAAGYYVLRSLPTPPSPQVLRHSSLETTLNRSSMLSQNFSVTFNNIWTAVKTTFAEYLAIPLDSIINSQVYIYLTSVYVDIQGSQAVNDSIIGYSNDVISFSYTSTHTASHSYYSILPYSTNSYRVIKVTPQSGSVTTAIYSNSPEGNSVASIVVEGKWNELQPGSLTVDMPLMTASTSSASNYVVSATLGLTVGVQLLVQL